MAHAYALAAKAAIPIGVRREGEVMPPDFSVYPSGDEASIGAFLRRGRTITGWRWSIRLKKCFDYSHVAP